MKCTECKVGYCAYRSTDPQRECPIQNGLKTISTPTEKSGKGFIVPEGARMVVDWSSFRREAAKDILPALIEMYGLESLNKETWCKQAIEWADELIKQLKQE